jgi:hypothetical protein
VVASVTLGVFSKARETPTVGSEAGVGDIRETRIFGVFAILTSLE